METDSATDINNNNDAAELENEYSNEESTKSPIQEVEEEPFVKVEIRLGLEQLKEAMKSNEVKNIRSCFNNLTKSYPTANLIWYSWAQYEYVNGNFDELEKLFTKCLKNNLSVPLWKLYLSYVRNNQLPNILDESEARQTMLKAYDFAVSHIGLDVASGPIWEEYLEFTQSNYYKLANEKISTWEQQQLMDLTRKVYHRALLNPMEGLEDLWHAYDAYENNLNKLTAKKLVAEKSSGYMAARSALKELHDLISGINLDEYPVGEEYDEVCETEDYEERFESWMKWINWERKNPLTTANKPLLHSRIVYAFRRALMSMRGDEEMWLTYSNYLRFEANRVDDAEVVLKQARKFCPLSVLIVLAAVDLKEARVGDLDAIRPILDEYISGTENKLNELKSEIIELARRPSGSDDDEIVFESALVERQFPQVHEYLRLRKSFNCAQVRLLELSRRLGGLSAGRTVFATARKSVHAWAEVFSAAARLEFRIRKDAQIAAKIYELGFNRFPSDRSFAREYLNFLLAQNDDGNIRALFERIIASIEGFRSTHSLELIRLNEDVEVIKSIWADFCEFEKEIGDFQSIAKLEDRMRAAFPDEIDFKPETLFMKRIKDSRSNRREASLDSHTAEFSLPRVKSETEALKPFNLPESLFNLLLKINESVKTYEGPTLDIERFVSFIERASLPSTDRMIEKETAVRPTRTLSSNVPPIRRRRRDDDDEREYVDDRRASKRVNSSIFEERRRY